MTTILPCRKLSVQNLVLPIFSQNLNTTRNVRFIILRDGDVAAPLGFKLPRIGSRGGTMLARHGRQIEPETNMLWDESAFTGSGMICTNNISSSNSKTVVYHPELVDNKPFIHFIVSMEQLRKIPVSHH